MSASALRIAPRTRQRPTRRKSLPPLQVGLYDEHGDLIKVVSLPDPRVEYCRQFDDMGQKSGMSARPIGGAK
jgi:hypothetical protein